MTTQTTLVVVLVVSVVWVVVIAILRRVGSVLTLYEQCIRRIVGLVEKDDGTRSEANNLHGRKKTRGKPKFAPSAECTNLFMCNRYGLSCPHSFAFIKNCLCDFVLMVLLM